MGCILSRLERIVWSRYDDRVTMTARNARALAEQKERVMSSMRELIPKRIEAVYDVKIGIVTGFEGVSLQNEDFFIGISNKDGVW